MDDQRTQRPDLRSIARLIAERLKSDLLSDYGDPARLELVRRSSQTLAEASVASLGQARVDPDVADQVRAAVAALAGLASASVEEAAAAARRAVSDVLTEALHFAVSALVVL